MGLDITAYRKLMPDPAAEVDDDGYPKDYRKYFRPGAALDWSERTWPGCCPELTEGTIYSHAGSIDFRAGSYSGYNEWRSWLARVADYQSANDYWENATPDTPFYELINFADNEGVIGAATAAELFKDFCEYRGHVEVIAGDDWTGKLFRTWQLACEIAADGGAINFH